VTGYRERGNDLLGSIIGETEWRIGSRKQLLDDLKKTGRHWTSKEKALDPILWRSRFGRGYGPVVRQTTSRWWIGG
jgi:hypothetical protein